ncbi:transposase [bacterium]|nr:transposase [bacterium]
MPSKYTRHNIPGHAHELTFSCYKRQPFLKNDNIKEILAIAINNASNKHHFDTWAYVFMPEHVHILIYPQEEIYSISNILKSIKLSTSKKVIARLRKKNSQYLKYMRTGLKQPEYRFWQDGGGYDRNYITPKEILKQIKYIHNNPIRRDFVDDPTKWKWSSAGLWLRGEDGPVAINKESIPMI